MTEEVKHQIESFFEPDIVWLGEINRQTLQLEREAGVLPPQATHLRCDLYRDEEGCAGISLSLRVGETELRSRAEDSSPVAATRLAFEDLSRQLSAYLEDQRRKGFWSRTSRNLGVQANGRISPATRREAIEGINRYLSTLFNFVRREIAYRQAVRDLVAGDLSAEEVVDEVALTALEQFDARPRELDFSHWLLQLALDVIERRVGEIKEERESLLHVEEDALETPPEEEVAHEGDEIFEFYQPDEDLRLEDLIRDERVPTPEEALAQRELQQYIVRTLARLPRRWREAFVLYSVEGLTLEEAARVTRRPVDDVRRAVELAREYLRECLVEAGAIRESRRPSQEEVRAR